MTKHSLFNIHNLYIFIVITIGFFISFSHNIYMEILEINYWIPFLLLITAVVLANHFGLLLPPKGNQFSLDSTFILAALFAFGLQWTLLVLICSTVLSMLYQRQLKWWVHLFNYSTYVMMTCGAYYSYIFLGGEIGILDVHMLLAYILALTNYFLINIILVGCILIIVYKDKSLITLKNIFLETMSTYILTLILALTLGIVLKNQPIFGVILFTLIMILLSIIFKRYYYLYEKVLNDKKYNAQILDSLPVGIITFIDDTFEVSLNDYAEKLLDVDSKTVKSILSSKDEPQVNERFWNIMLSKGVFYNVKIAYNKDGNSQTLLVSHSELKNQSDQLVGRIYNFTDITETEVIQQRTHQLEKLAVLGELTAGAAHEIRNPLTAIQGFFGLMERSLSEADRNRFHLPLMLKEFDRINFIIDEMLSHAKPGQAVLEEAYIEDILEEVISFYQYPTAEQQIQFTIKLERTPLLLDIKQIKQVLYNLVRNSIEAMENKGAITIYSNKSNSAFELFIEDNGTGIPVEIQDTIFEPFYTNKEIGTGLGLTIIQRIIENHHGNIELVSSSNSGTTFKISLPLQNKE
ncbi:two-component system sensor histidine kinase NtrB [Radiobacillus sp. PE A8.2]|uniref:two-component system sensor histidine kinase NtrB n=1 Tax=Radiobacillus sp. PE A8.2 TaxID=3380349 RepID=UPI003890DE3C